MSKSSVLIVEGNRETRSVIREAVERLGDFLIVESEDGSDGMVKASRQKFDVMITNVDLPKLDGFSMLRTIIGLAREVWPKNVFILGAEEDRVEEFKAFRAKAVPLPTDADSLVAIIGPVLEAAKAPPKKIDVSFINPFIDAALEVLGTMASTQATKEAVYIRKDDNIGGDISAIIAMNSSRFRGSMAISFEANTFLSIMSKMLGETYTQIDSGNCDGAGELCNQIFGVTKKTLNAAGHDIQPALPSVVYGTDHKIKHLVDGPCITVKFKTEFGYFYVEAVVS